MHKAAVSSPTPVSYVHSQKQTSTAAQATSFSLIDDHGSRRWYFAFSINSGGNNNTIKHGRLGPLQPLSNSKSLL